MTTQDVNNVQSAIPEPPKAEAVAQNQPPVNPPPPVEQPLTREAVAQLIKETLSPFMETSKREIQSAKDKSRAEIERAIKDVRMRDAAIQKIRQKVLANNPEFENEIKLAEYEAKDEAGRYVDSEAQAREQWAQAVNEFNTSMNQFIQDMGLDPKHKEIDWADDETHPNGIPNLQGRQKRILASVGKIQKAAKAEQEAVYSKRLKDAEKEIENRIRASLGLDTVSTPGNPATPSGMPTTRKDFAKWVDKLPDDEYKKRRSEILAWQEKLTQ